MAIRIPNRKTKGRVVRVTKVSRVGQRAPPLVPDRFTVPPLPNYTKEENHMLYEEQQVSRTAILMLKGVRERHALMTLLDVNDTRAMDRYMARVIARWEMVGTVKDHSRHRGEGLQRLDALEVELWTKVQTRDDDRVAVASIKTLLDIQKHRTELLGLTPKVIEKMGQLDAEGGNFTKRIEQHEKLGTMAERMLQLIDERSRTIEHDANSQEATATVERTGPEGDRPTDDRRGPSRQARRLASSPIVPSHRQD